MQETVNAHAVAAGALGKEGSSMGLSDVEDLDFIVYVDPKAYYEMPYTEKTRVARAVSAFN